MIHIEPIYRIASIGGKTHIILKEGAVIDPMVTAPNMAVITICDKRTLDDTYTERMLPDGRKQVWKGGKLVRDDINAAP